MRNMHLVRQPAIVPEGSNGAKPKGADEEEAEEELSSEPVYATYRERARARARDARTCTHGHTRARAHT